MVRHKRKVITLKVLAEFFNGPDYSEIFLLSCRVVLLCVRQGPTRICHRMLDIVNRL